jgi:cytochrome c peroxidase
MSDAARRGQALFFDHRLEYYHLHTCALFSDNRQTARTPFPENAFHNTGLYNIVGKGTYPAGGSGFSNSPASPLTWAASAHPP